MAKKTESSSPNSGIEINTAADANWAQAADGLPEKVTINGKEFNTDNLSGSARKLLAIYLADLRIVSQQKEMLALAELGLKALVGEIEKNLPDD